MGGQSREGFMTQLATGSSAARDAAPLSAAERFGVVDMPDLVFTPAVARCVNSWKSGLNGATPMSYSCAL